MDLFNKINEVKYSEEINELKIKKEELFNLTLHELDVFDDIHYLLGKYKKGIELVKINGSTKEYGYLYQEILFSRIGIRYRSFYENHRRRMSLEDMKKEFKSKKIITQLNENLKPEGQEILKYLIKEIPKLKKMDNRENKISCLIPLTIEDDVHKILDKNKSKNPKYPRIEGSFDYNAVIKIDFNSYESIGLNNRDDFESLAIEERYHKELSQCIDELTEKIKQYNKEIDDINSGFKTTFAKYLLLNNI